MSGLESVLNSIMSNMYRVAAMQDCCIKLMLAYEIGLKNDIYAWSLYADDMLNAFERLLNTSKHLEPLSYIKYCNEDINAAKDRACAAIIFALGVVNDSINYTNQVEPDGRNIIGAYVARLNDAKTELESAGKLFGL